MPGRDGGGKEGLLSHSDLRSNGTSGAVSDRETTFYGVWSDLGAHESTSWWKLQIKLEIYIEGIN